MKSPSPQNPNPNNPIPNNTVQPTVTANNQLDNEADRKNVLGKFISQKMPRHDTEKNFEKLIAV